MKTLVNSTHVQEKLHWQNLGDRVVLQLGVSRRLRNASLQGQSTQPGGRCVSSVHVCVRATHCYS